MFQLVNRGRRVFAEIFDGVLIAEPVGPFNGVVHVPAPVVFSHIAERSGDAPLRRDRMRACREHLRDAGGLQARLRGAKRCAQSRAAGADDDDVIFVIDNFVTIAHVSACE